MTHHRLPPGTGLLLAGSGVYWTLSSQLIGSPTALAPGLLQSPNEVFLLLCAGITCIIAGSPFLVRDLRRLRELFERADGWLFTIPIGLAAADLELTLVGLSTGRVGELNPFVSAATTAGPTVIVLFLLSYIALSEGLGILMIGFGHKLYRSSTALRNLPYALVCGVAAFGPFSNLGLILLGTTVPALSYLLGSVVSALLSFETYSVLRKP